MSAEVPNVLWQSLRVEKTPPASYPFAGTVPVGGVLRAAVLVFGSASTVYQFEVLANAGSDAFQLPSPGSLLSGSELQVGMPIVPAVQAAPPAGIPNGLVIAGINKPSAGSIELGGFYPATSTTWTYTQPASETIDIMVSAVDQYPEGVLNTSVTPSTGVTIRDYSFDSTGNDGNVGDGQGMCNNNGQAVGDLGVTFADAGTYTVTVTYVSYDVDYANATISLPVTVS